MTATAHTSSRMHLWLEQDRLGLLHCLVAVENLLNTHFAHATRLSPHTPMCFSIHVLLQSLVSGCPPTCANPAKADYHSKQAGSTHAGCHRAYTQWHCVNLYYFCISQNCAMHTTCAQHYLIRGAWFTMHLQSKSVKTSTQVNVHSFDKSMDCRYLRCHSNAWGRGCETVSYPLGFGCRDLLLDELELAQQLCLLLL